MRILRIQSLCCFFEHSSAITLLGVIQSTPQLSTLNTLLSAKSSINITNFLSTANNFTFLALSNDAIARFNAIGPNNLTGDLLTATLQYSLLQGEFPTTSITSLPQFVQSYLVNPTFANITSGQVVELVVSDGTAGAITGNKTISATTSAVCLQTPPFTRLLTQN
jgi:hypothetical protein